MSYFDKIVKLTKQLYPTGRAWKMPFNGFFEKLENGLALSDARFYEDCKLTQDSFMPDNDNFSIQDCRDWERRLGLFTNEATPIADRKLAIKRKMAYPGINPARGSAKYIESQLQAAGFSVYVHENMFPIYPQGWYSVDPVYLLPQVQFAQLGDKQLNEFQLGSAQSYYSQYITCSQLGNFQLGDLQMDECVWSQKVVNSIYNDEDKTFNLGNTFNCTIIIGGSTLGTFANVLASREVEFRQLILRLKQTQIVAILNIKYT